MKRSLTSHISDLITIYLLGKELADWDATPCVKNHGWILTVSSKLEINQKKHSEKLRYKKLVTLITFIDDKEYCVFLFLNCMLRILYFSKKCIIFMYIYIFAYSFFQGPGCKAFNGTLLFRFYILRNILFIEIEIHVLFCILSFYVQLAISEICVLFHWPFCVMSLVL